jgi:hypothetical protein
VNETLNVTACTTGSINVLTNDSDPDGNLPLTLYSMADPLLGTLSFGTDGNVTYTAGNAPGQAEAIEYVVKDSLGAANGGTLFVNVGNAGNGECDVSGF